MIAKTSRAVQVAREMNSFGIDILGISEGSMKGIRSMRLQSGEWIVYVENEWPS